MIRHLARELALQALFQLDFSAERPVDEVLTAAAHQHQGREVNPALEYAKVLVEGILPLRQELDDVIAKFSKGWKLERMGHAEVSVLRLAIYELQFAEPKVVPAVAINEAVELAKVYCDDEAPKFINGILGQVVRA
ncbi:MAG: transcription antitermination factor NusB [Phascolarctobacterium sp.]|nr:transcription antitermination factor NusB [Candidatus Phascolarctobacterium equi]